MAEVAGADNFRIRKGDRPWGLTPPYRAANAPAAR
jgi:hypothetical protein